MCEFCTQHGEGKKWYLNARNYATELVNELDRQKFIEHFFHDVIFKGNRQMSLLEKFFGGRISIPAKIRSRATERQKISHFGQIIPIEEIPKMLSMANTITRITCGCQWAAEKKESRTCYGLSVGPPHWFDQLDFDFFGSPDLASFETLTRQEAYDAMLENDRQGMVHSLWTFETPFIGAICNCNSRYCLAMRSTVGLKIPVMFRAEYIAALDETLCSGCKACIKKCQFDAIQYNGKKKPVTIDPVKCYGCGVCRASCPDEAICLEPREKHPTASQLWI